MRTPSRNRDPVAGSGLAGRVRGQAESPALGWRRPRWLPLAIAPIMLAALFGAALSTLAETPRRTDEADAKAAPAAAQENLIDQNPEMVNWFKKALGRTMQREIYFVHKTCELTPDQWRRLMDGSEQYLQKRAKVAAKQLKNEDQLSILSESVERLQERTAERVMKTLNPKQIVKLKKGLADRSAFRRRVLVMTCVTLIDQQFALSAEQRNKLTAKLAAEWNDGWGVEPVLIAGGSSGLPSIPTKVLKGILTEAQLKTWESLPKESNRSPVEYVLMMIEAETDANQPDDTDFDLPKLDPKFKQLPSSAGPRVANPTGVSRPQPQGKSAGAAK